MRLPLLPALLLVGCSSGAPDDVLLLQGSAPAGSELVLERRLSHVCFHPPEIEVDAEPFEALARTTAGAAGEYTFELYRAQTSPGGDLRACFRVTRAGDPRMEARTQFFAGDVRLPPLTGWGDVPLASEAGWTLAALPALPSGSLETAAAYEWQLDTGGQPLWRADAQTALSPPAELFEDFSEGVLRASAHGRFLHFDDSLGLAFSTYTEGSLLLRTDEVALTSTGGLVPLTRGTACWLDGVETSPCPATDGALTPARLRSEDGLVQSMELRLPAPRALRRLVLRGFEEYAPSLRIEVAHGAGDWQPVTEFVTDYDTVDGASQALRTPGRWEVVALGGVVADRLRLVVETGGIYAVREVSVFE